MVAQLGVLALARAPPASCAASTSAISVRSSQQADGRIGVDPFRAQPLHLGAAFVEFDDAVGVGRLATLPVLLLCPVRAYRRSSQVGYACQAIEQDVSVETRDRLTGLCEAPLGATVSMSADRGAFDDSSHRQRHARGFSALCRGPEPARPRRPRPAAAPLARSGGPSRSARARPGGSPGMPGRRGPRSRAAGRCRRARAAASSAEPCRAGARRARPPAPCRRPRRRSRSARPRGREAGHVLDHPADLQ